MGENENVFHVNGNVSVSPPGRKKDVDWHQFGLSTEEKNHSSSIKNSINSSRESNEQVKELFEHEQENGLESDQDPWWKSNFFITKKILFGTWDGVFTSCVMNIVGVVVFLRTGWMVGFAGTGLSLLMVLISFLVAFATVMSAVGICDRCDIGSGGVYYILTHVLGGKVGATVGLLYSVGHAIATSLYCTGLAETLVDLLKIGHSWAIRLVSIATLLVMLAIAISGVKWIVRFQLVLIVILAVAMLDFLIGTLAQEKPEAGFTGFSSYNFEENLQSEFTSDTTFFVVFGVFFPTACGVLAGVNMSGDLKEPSQNIPEGSVASLGVCGGLYTIVVLFFGSTCTRHALQTDFLIMEKISLVGGLLLFGLFVAALSSVLGGLVGPPRVLQRIAEDNVLPILKPFAQLAGANREPRNATLLCASITLMFIFVGNLNKLAPIVTMPFLTTYMSINYAYFAMAMSYDLKLKQTMKVEGTLSNNNNNSSSTKTNGKKSDSKKSNGNFSYGALKNQRSFEEMTPVDGLPPLTTDENSNAEGGAIAFEVKEPPVIAKTTEEGETTVDNNAVANDVDVELNVESNLVSAENISHGYQRQRTVSENGQYIDFIHERNVNSLYGRVCNRWVSLFASLVCLVLSFCISWVYALANMCITLMLYICISQARPGLAPGVASDFKLSSWAWSLFQSKKKDEEKEHIIIQNSEVPYGYSTHVVTQDNMDYEHRDKKHHASIINNPVPYN